MNETLIALIAGIAVGVGLSVLYLAYRIKLVMNTLDQYIEQAIEQVTDTFLKIIVEKHSDIYYCYRKEDHQFLCQGTDIDSLLSAFRTQFPDKTAVIAEETDAGIRAEFRQILNK